MTWGADAEYGLGWPLRLSRSLWTAATKAANSKIKTELKQWPQKLFGGRDNRSSAKVAFVAVAAAAVCCCFYNYNYIVMPNLSNLKIRTPKIGFAKRSKGPPKSHSRSGQRRGVEKQDRESVRETCGFLKLMAVT